MKKTFCIILLAVSLFNSLVISAQDTTALHLTSESVNQLGLVNIGSSQNWKYHPGDDLNWADPDFDDSHWHNIIPGGLGIEQMPDSLWNGYGWWRLTFTADSSFYAGNWTMYFFGWGAAEVYLDGRLVHSFGNFSTNQDQEHTFSPPDQIYPPLQIFEKVTHTIAVRYSYHQAKQYNFFMKDIAEVIGFSIGFGTHAYNEYIAEIKTYSAFTLFVSGAVLFVLLLLHLMLYYKFPEDRTNLFLSITFALLLTSLLASYNFVYADLTRYWYIILDFIWAHSVRFAILFLPYVIAVMFKLENLKKVLWLLAGLPLLVIIGFFNSELSTYIALVLLTFSIFFVGYICWRAYREKRKGVHYVALGALGTLSLVIVYVLFSAGNVQLDFRGFYIMVAFLFTLFPLGLTLYVADGYGYLITSLEKEVDERTYELNQSLSNLKSTQSKLIQQEKLASLGQLTAGIAHEIQNPLNFVNNFSEVSAELVEEVAEERAKSPDTRDETLVTEILGDIKENLSKITLHGKRADAIVKGMLEHSRTGSGVKELTDVNALAKEYLNLSYQSFISKNKEIEIELITDFDPTLLQLELVRPEIGKVLLNILNNAFYASALEGHTERSRSATVSLSTKNLGDKIEIKVSDNGPGIPDSIKDKIFQPFFTTKPTGQGTGLGLSLSYDIVKAHGGELKVETEEGKGSEFIIKLPIS